MSGASKSLANVVGTLKKKRSLTPDVLKGRSVSLSESSEMQVRDVLFGSTAALGLPATVSWPISNLHPVLSTLSLSCQIQTVHYILRPC